MNLVWGWSPNVIIVMVPIFPLPTTLLVEPHIFPMNGVPKTLLELASDGPAILRLTGPAKLDAKTYCFRHDPHHVPNTVQEGKQ